MQLMERILELGAVVDMHPWKPYIDRGKLLLMQWKHLLSANECGTVFAQRRALAKDANDVLDALRQVTEADTAGESKGRRNTVDDWSAWACFKFNPAAEDSLLQSPSNKV